MSEYNSMLASLQSNLSQAPSVFGAGSGSEMAVFFSMGRDENITSSLTNIGELLAQKKGILGAVIGPFATMQGLMGFQGIQPQSLSILGQLNPPSPNVMNIEKLVSGLGTQSFSGQGK